MGETDLCNDSVQCFKGYSSIDPKAISLRDAHFPDGFIMAHQDYIIFSKLLVINFKKKRFQLVGDVFFLIVRAGYEDPPMFGQLITVKQD